MAICMICGNELDKNKSCPLGNDIDWITAEEIYYDIHGCYPPYFGIWRD